MDRIVAVVSPSVSSLTLFFLFQYHPISFCMFSHGNWQQEINGLFESNIQRITLAKKYIYIYKESRRAPLADSTHVFQAAE